jgi:hypothetical protein
MLSRLRRNTFRNRGALCLVSGSAVLLLHNISPSCNDSNDSSEKRSAGAVSLDGGFTADSPLFLGECFEKQMYKPKLPYPAWDYDWDGRSGVVSNFDVARGNPSTRHILLVRHGQYEQGSPDDKDQVLTPLGQSQARHTGRRLASIMNMELLSTKKYQVCFCELYGTGERNSGYYCERA